MIHIIKERKIMASLLYAILLSPPVVGDTRKSLSFGMINGGSPFFEPVEHGWEHKCRELGVTCHYRVVGDEPCETSRNGLIDELLSLKVDGISMKPCGWHEKMRPLVDQALEAGVPIVTFDSDIPDSNRAAYVGTDNRFLGQTMAKLLRQLRPEGGTFATVGYKEDRTEGFLEEIMKYNGKKGKGQWYPVPADFNTEGDNYMEQMEKFALLNATAMVAMKQTPMRHPNWTNFVDANRYRQITYIGTDGADYQLSYLSRRYVDGLVGQLPFEMGSSSMEVLYDLVTEGKIEKTIFPTNLVAYNLIPLGLPELQVDKNLLNNLVYVGYICFAVVVLSALVCLAWTIVHRTSLVVHAAQPFFLYMVACGVIILSGSLVPLSFDDDGEPSSMNTTRRVGVCMSVPWLACIGFSVTFSALFSKTWRVNRVFHSKDNFARLKVTEKDVLAPFAILVTCNILVLTCWTVIDPLEYVREENDGTDYWNRVISTYGACRSDHVLRYLVPLAIINASVIAIACVQAFQAREIKSEFSESTYIGLAVGSLFQAFLTGLPILVIVKNSPQAYYLVLTLMIFVLCMVILLLIFLPKVLLHQKYSGMSESEQRRALKKIVRNTATKNQPIPVPPQKKEDSSDLHVFSGKKKSTPVPDKIEDIAVAAAAAAAEDDHVEGEVVVANHNVNRGASLEEELKE